jgi:hypothetical protein
MRKAPPVLFRRELDVRLLRDGRAIAHLNYPWHAGRLERRVAPDGSLRFASSDH